MIKAVAGRLALSRDSCQKACVKSVLENQQEPAKAEIKDSMVGGLSATIFSVGVDRTEIVDQPPPIIGLG